MPKDKDFEIKIGGRNGFGGYAPSYYENTYSYYGNPNQLNSAVSIDLIDPNVLTQGPGVTDLTGGSQAGELGSELIVSILRNATSSNVSYACSNDKIFKISATAVSNGTFPLTLNAGTANVATHMIEYNGVVYIFWNDTGVDGDIAKLTLPSTLDCDWGSTTPATGAAQLEDAPHYGIVGGDNAMYVTNSQYVAKYKSSTDVLTVQGLDFWSDAETVSLTWNWNRVIIALNRPNVTGSNFNLSGIYRWNGISPSFEGDPIEVNGEIGALYTKNGTTYVWWKDSINDGGCNFGLIDGTKLVPITRYAGTLPNQAQVGEYDGFIGWISNNILMLWGAKDTKTPVKLFPYMVGKYATIGTWAAPFGTPLISSNASTNYSLAKASGYTVTSSFNTIAYDVSGANYRGVIDTIQVAFETLSTGATVDFTLYYDDAASNKSLTQITYSATDATTIRKILTTPIEVNNFQLKGNFANGSATNNVAIRGILIKGHYIQNE